MVEWKSKEIPVMTTMPNGKTFLQNVDGMLTTRANFTLTKYAITAILVIFLAGAPIWSFIIYRSAEYANNTEKFQPLKQEFLALNAQRDNMSYLDYCSEIYELDEQWKILIETTEEEDTFSYGWLWWVLFPFEAFVVWMYLRMFRHYWRTPFRIIYFPYLLVNCAFIARFFMSFDGTGLTNSIYMFFVYNYSPSYYFWHYVNVGVFFFYIVFYLVFMFGRPEPEARFKRVKARFFEGELPLSEIFW